MRFCFSDKLYSDGFSDNKLKTIRGQIVKGKFKPGIFLITLPLVDEGMLEIYRYIEFLQPAYKEIGQDITVVGIAKSKEDAFSLVERIVKDVGYKDGKIDIKGYFEI